MKKTFQRIVPAAILSAFVCIPAFAQATFNFSSGVTNCNTRPAEAHGNQASCTPTSGSAPATVAVSAWSTTAAGALLNSGPAFASASLSDQGGSGWGAKNQTEGLSASPPDHSVDNLTPGFVDTLLLNFSATTSLGSLTMNWVHNDSDISVFRWTGAVTGPTIAGSGSGETLANNGWSLVGNYSNLTTSARTITTDASVYSSWWLVSSFSSSLSGSTTCRASGENTGSGTATCDNGNDGFKLGGLTTLAAICASGQTGTPNTGGGGCSTPGGANGVPEPTSLALMAIAALSGVATRRRFAKRA